MTVDVDMSDNPIPDFAKTKHALGDLARLCFDHPYCAKLVHFLYSRPRTCMTPGDISACAGLTKEETRWAIDTLAEMDLLRCLSVDDLTFYGLSDDESVAEAVRDFERWCEGQLQHWESVQQLVC
jgi:hypothetical protein